LERGGRQVKDNGSDESESDDGEEEAAKVGVGGGEEEEVRASNMEDSMATGIMGRGGGAVGSQWSGRRPTWSGRLGGG